MSTLRSARMFKPSTDRLEKLAGASTFMLGELADAVLGGVDQLKTVALSPPMLDSAPAANVHQSFDLSIQLATPVPQVVVTGAADDVFHLFQQMGQPAPAQSAFAPTPAGLIRPLTLIPAPQSIRITAIQPISLSMALANAVGSGIKGASMSPVQSAPPVIALPTPFIPASNGNSAPTGYIVTGGSSGPAYYAGANFAGSGGSGGGSGTNSGPSTNSGTCTNSNTDQISSAQFNSAGNTAGVTTSSDGNFSIQPPSGGNPIQGTLSIKPTYPPPSGGGPPYYIGSPADLKVVSSVGYPTNIGWTVSGNAYSGNTFNSTYGSMQWVHPKFVPPIALGNIFPDVSFYWGEKSGTYTVDVTADVGTGSGTAYGVKAQITVVVKDPDIKGEVSWLPRPEIFGNSFFRYRYYDIQTEKAEPGISWNFSSANGSLAVEQLLTMAVISNSSPTATKSGPTDAQGNGAPFPLVDVETTNIATYPMPWYTANGSKATSDSPGFSLTNVPDATSAHMYEAFLDYVMFDPPGGIFVPTLQFVWDVHDTATKDASGKWGVTNPGSDTAGVTSDPEKDSTWPATAVDAPANKYGSMS